MTKETRFKHRHKEKVFLQTALKMHVTITRFIKNANEIYML
jgi:hypothetical protein